MSVIVRFKNEAAFLPAVLAAARAQRVSGASVRVIGVDNGSSDDSRTIAERMCDRVLAIDDYMPGAAINLAMREEPCEFAAVLSAHTIPSSNTWLQSLLAEAQKPETLGVYGAQLYPINSRFLDKRDLDIFSTQRVRIEVRDSDFWNANSLFPRSSWDAGQFDERTFELEDHYWTKCRLDGRNVVRFVPDALVYHYTHIARNDRVFLPPVKDTDAERIAQSVATLNDRSAEWPQTMMAALTVKSLKHEPSARLAIPLLVRHLAEHWDFDIRWRMAGTLSKLPDIGAVDALITALSDPSFYARDEAAWALAELGPFAAPRLLDRLSTVPPREWPLAALALGRTGHPDAERKAVELIDNGLRETEGSLKLNYAYAAGEVAVSCDASRLATHLNSLLDDDDGDARAVGVWAAGSLAATLRHHIDWRRVRASAASDPDPMVRVEAVAALGKTLHHADDPAAVMSLSTATRDPNARVRYVALQSARLLAEAQKGIVPVPEVLDEEDHGLQFEWKMLKGAMAEAFPVRGSEDAP